MTQNQMVSEPLRSYGHLSKEQTASFVITESMITSFSAQQEDYRIHCEVNQNIY